MTKIIVVTPNYPSKKRPERGAFVENLVNSWRSQGEKVSVINPRSIFSPDEVRFKPHITDNGKENYLCVGSYLSFSNIKIGPMSTGTLSRKLFQKCAFKCYNFIKPELPYFFYGKFLMTGGGAAAKLSEVTSVPAFVDLGESNLAGNMSRAETKEARGIVSKLSGAVCVSNRLREEAISLGFSADDVLLCPNFPDLDRFYSLSNKAKVRRQLGIPLDKFVVIFAGHFIERKGPKRVLAAIERARDDVCGIFLGQGPESVSGDRVLFSGPVKPEEVNLWLNAADVFMLPTTAEGHCNAINEAMAAGLPIITSSIRDVDAQVNERNSIRVDPYDVDGMANAINELQADKLLRESMSKSSRDFILAKKNHNRESVILQWIREKIN